MTDKMAHTNKSGPGAALTAPDLADHLIGGVDMEEGNSPHRPRLKPGESPRLGSPHGLPLRDRFWVKVRHSPTGCWEWAASKNTAGYGQVSLGGGKIDRAHRVCWQMVNGPIPEGMNVLHRCDNRACVRPSHLFLGTHRDNMQDALKKGRLTWPVARGEGHGAARLTWNDVREIRRLRSEGAVYRELAEMFGVGISQVARITRGESWSV